ncbi:MULTISPECIES: type II secretion system protein [Acinetobacter]|uniref:type II secretion system protein n=1 Tax=Acinetobacter TaxID=469 RepID=UPI000235FC58|nr:MULTISPECIES: type II secretion system protein [Acinetobacter]GAB02064.1 general secretion pathway protein H [Acinetobacter sp. NBRC 100985]
MASSLATRSSVARFNRVSGFTLIEVMVVIVIMTIMASLVVLNIGGVDQRRAMQAREMFILDLKKINKEATDQAKVFALNTQNATDVAPFSYNLFEYHDQSKEQIQQEDRTWQPYVEFKTRQLPEQVSFSIESLDNESYPKANNEDLLGGKAPQLIWFGNGEVKPVRIQFYYQQQAIGHEFELDHLGKVNEN